MPGILFETFSDLFIYRIQIDKKKLFIETFTEQKVGHPQFFFWETNEGFFAPKKRRVST